VTSVEAAGGVVFRNGHVALVHRPMYDDWTLPKGKLEPGEDRVEAALREVAEETGLGCLVGPALGTIEYVDARGRGKTVHYWAMAATTEALAPTKEVDAARWVPLGDAPGQLTYERDRDVLACAAALLPSDPVAVFFVRHAKAGDRDKWDAPDELRPLTRPGRAQAEALAGVLAKRHPVVVVSSPYVRCVETLQPLGATLGLPVQDADALAEGASAEEALALLGAAATFGPAVACTHGDVQQWVIESLAETGVSLSSPQRFAKGSTWELALERGRFMSGRYIPPPA
jgi:8-oxo-(d)GTP phosphatase